MMAGEDDIKEKLRVVVDGTAEEETPNTVEDMMGIGRISQQLVEAEKIKFLSDITPEMENVFSILLAVNVKLGSKLLEDYIYHRLTLRVSIKGRGRKDMVELAKAIGMAVAAAINGSTANLEGKGGFLGGLRDKVR